MIATKLRQLSTPLSIGLFLALVSPIVAQTVPASSQMIPGANSVNGPTWVSVDGQANGACSNCGPSGTNPGLWAQPAPSQVALYTGACQPCIRGVDCADEGERENRWADARLIDFQPLGHGEFMGPVRIPAFLEQRVRSGDELRFTYINSRQQISPEYRLQVGDELKISSFTDTQLQMGDTQNGVAVQPDGNIHVRMIGAVRAAGLTIPQLRVVLEKGYQKWNKSPSIDVEPFPGRTNTLLRDLQSIRQRPVCGWWIEPTCCRKC